MKRFSWLYSPKYNNRFLTPLNHMLPKLLSVPKSIWVNFRYLPFRIAIKFPIAISYNTRVRCHGKISIVSENISAAMIRIGFHKVPVCNRNDETTITISNGGLLCFRGQAHLGNGTKLHVAKDAILSLGNNFAISASSSINCYHKIEMGTDIQFSWGCLVMDSDTHCIFDEQGNILNEDRPIILGEKIWIGCNTTILKGATIPSNCIIGANSVVTGSKFDKGTIIVGNPAKSIKKVGGWRL